MPRGLPDLPIDPNGPDAAESGDLENQMGRVLGLESDARGLSEFITYCDTPMTVGIQGDWGSGKSSLMKLIQHHLREDKARCVHVEFNTWQYSQFGQQEMLGASLLQALSRSLYELPRGKKSDWPGTETRKVFKRFARGLARATTVMIGNAAATGAAAATAGGVSFSGEQFLDAFKAEDEAMDGARLFEQLKVGFADIVQETLKALNKDKVVFYIDDLDRLPPHRAIELLEVIKNFIDVRGGVYVLAIDYDVIIRGLQQRKGYSGEKLGAEEGKSFFDKIIQVPYRMPTSTYRSERFLVEKYAELNLAPAQLLLWRSTASAFCWENAKSGGRRVASEDLKKMLKLSQNQPHPEDLLFLIRRGKDLVEASIGHNPRSIKRLLNLNLLLTSMRKFRSTGRSKKLSPRERVLLLALTAMQMAHFRVYRLLANNVRHAEAYLLAWWLAPHIHERLDSLEQWAARGDQDDNSDDPYQQLTDLAAHLKTGGSGAVLGIATDPAQASQLKRAFESVAAELRAMEGSGTLNRTKLDVLARLASVVFDAVDINETGQFEELQRKRLRNLLRLAASTSVEGNNSTEAGSRRPPVTFAELRDAGVADLSELHFHAENRNARAGDVGRSATPLFGTKGSRLRVTFMDEEMTLARATSLVIGDLNNQTDEHRFSASERGGNVSAAQFWAVLHEGEYVSIKRLVEWYWSKDTERSTAEDEAARDADVQDDDNDDNDTSAE